MAGAKLISARAIVVINKTLENVVFRPTASRRLRRNATLKCVFSNGSREEDVK